MKSDFKKDWKRSHKTHDVCHGHKGFSPHKSSTSRSNEVVHGKEEKHEKSSAIKCFKCLGRGHIASQCPSKKTMICVDGVYHSTSSSSNDTSSCEASSSDEELYPNEGDLLVVRRLLGSHPKDDNSSQRENIFHTRCLVRDATCS